jgi:uncharacterized protein YgbK (DUF1537 family)
MKLMLGVIADDVTGATDIASTLVNQGLRVTQVLGVPDENSGDSIPNTIFSYTISQTSIRFQMQDGRNQLPTIN